MLFVSVLGLASVPLFLFLSLNPALLYMQKSEISYPAFYGFVEFVVSQSHCIVVIPIIQHPMF
jgi:hypothetical protein